MSDFDDNMHKIARAWQEGQPKTRTHKKGLGRVYKDYGQMEKTRSRKNLRKNPTRYDDERTAQPNDGRS